MIKKLLRSPYVFLFILVALMYYTPLKNITWGRIVNSQPATVTVFGTVESEADNQLANFSAGVNTRNADKEKAVGELNEKVKKLSDALVAFGISEKDILTQSLSVYQGEQYNEATQTTSKTDWMASNSLSIKLRDISRSDELAMLLTSSGADNIWGPNFTVDNETMSGDMLLDKAIDEARVKAESIAKKSGKRLGDVLFIQENGGGYGVMPYNNGGMMKDMGMGGGVAEMFPGTSTISKTVVVTYELK